MFVVSLQGHVKILWIFLVLYFHVCVLANPEIINLVERLIFSKSTLQHEWFKNTSYFTIFIVLIKRLLLFYLINKF